MEDDLQHRVRILELEMEELREMKQHAGKKSENTWVWAFVPILALLIPVLAIVRDMF